jgi:hypothetical protein
MNLLINIRFLTYAIILVSAVISFVSWKRSASATEVKSTIVECGLVVGGANPRPFSDLIAKADRVILKGENENAESLESDVEWVRRISQQISLLKLGEPNSCLCCGWMTAYFYEKEHLLGSVAPIHGNQIRVSSAVLAGDFEIPEEVWRVFESIFREKAKALNSTESTAGTHTPPNPSQVPAVPHL